MFYRQDNSLVYSRTSIKNLWKCISSPLDSIGLHFTPGY